MSIDERAYNDICNDVAEQTAKELWKEIDELKGENEQLKKALSKCNPWLMTTAQCILCGGKYNHTDDCKYVKLTEGE